MVLPDSCPITVEFIVSAPLGYNTSINPLYAIQACAELLGSSVVQACAELLVSSVSLPPSEVAGPADMHHWAWLFLLYTTDLESISIKGGAQQEMPMVGKLCSL